MTILRTPSAKPTTRLITTYIQVARPSSGDLRLNWRIVQAPMVLVDYVAAPEAVHLAHKNHTRAYWAEFARLVPDVESGRTELRRRGAAS